MPTKPSLHLVKRGVLPAGIALVICAGLAATTVALDRRFPPDLTRYRALSLDILDREGERLALTTSSDGFIRLQADPDQVSANYLRFLLHREDHRFWIHPGIDPCAFGRAAWQFVRYGHVVSGGSTLTMQVARLLVPHRHTLLGKIYDIVRAVQLEAHYSKHDILRMYLTLAPFGGNIEGVRAASLLYFGHEPDHLSDAQAALLVALPQHPARLRPDRHPAAAEAVTRRILTQVSPKAAASSGLPAILPRTQLTNLIPHLTDRLRASALDGTVHTTIDADLQHRVAILAQRDCAASGGSMTIAALIVDNRHRQILAYLGGTDYFGRQGMVDMVAAPRSPGSTLKPFIYGLAFDDSLIEPDTLIDDAAVSFGGYQPHDFDRDTHGRVTIRVALQQSYNLPAIKVMRLVGPSRFVSILRETGATVRLPRGVAPTLPVALGGLGISLRDLTMLYAGLADGGRVQRLQVIADEPVVQSVPVISAAATWEISDILRGTPRPEGVSQDEPRPIAFKTGTSYGFRDAWAVGYSPRYTIGVWVGHIDGSPRPGAYGLNTAAPLLFKFFDLLPTETDGTPPPPPGVARPDMRRLSPALQYFSSEEADGRRTPPLKILFPPASATLDVTSQDESDDGPHYEPIALEATGGQQPYEWAINGVPLASMPGVDVSWAPDGPGFAHISVTDQQHRTISEEVRLQ